MKVGRLKEILNRLDNNLEIFVRNSNNPIGNISDLAQLEKSTYASFGHSVPCIILNTSSSKEIETDEEDNDIDYIEEKQPL